MVSFSPKISEIDRKVKVRRRPVGFLNCRVWDKYFDPILLYTSTLKPQDWPCQLSFPNWLTVWPLPPNKMCGVIVNLAAIVAKKCLILSEAITVKKLNELRSNSTMLSNMWCRCCQEMWRIVNSDVVTYELVMQSLPINLNSEVTTYEPACIELVEW